MRIGKLEVFRDDSLSAMTAELLKLQWQDICQERMISWPRLRLLLKTLWSYLIALAGSWHWELNRG